MRNLSTGSGTYDGLKIPRTPSVKRRCREDEKKLLHLELRVLGATTKNRYETLCHTCKDREGDKDAFPDFRAKNDILVAKEDDRILVSFALACYLLFQAPQASGLRILVSGSWANVRTANASFQSESRLEWRRRVKQSFD